jgi:hypothetical protein
VTRSTLSAQRQIPGHRHDRATTPTPAAMADDAFFALLLISAAAIVDALLALVVLN